MVYVCVCFRMCEIDVETDLNQRNKNKCLSVPFLNRIKVMLSVIRHSDSWFFCDSHRLASSACDCVDIANVWILNMDENHTIFVIISRRRFYWVTEVWNIENFIQSEMILVSFSFQRIKWHFGFSSFAQQAFTVYKYH